MDADQLVRRAPARLQDGLREQVNLHAQYRASGLRCSYAGSLENGMEMFVWFRGTPDEEGWLLTEQGIRKALESVAPLKPSKRFRQLEIGFQHLPLGPALPESIELAKLLERKSRWTARLKRTFTGLDVAISLGLTGVVAGHVDARGWPNPLIYGGAATLAYLAIKGIIHDLIYVQE